MIENEYLQKYKVKEFFCLYKIIIKLIELQTVRISYGKLIELYIRYDVHAVK